MNNQQGFLKRPHYLCLLPVMVLALQGSWLVSALSGHTSPIGQISLLLMSLWLTILWLAFWKLRHYLLWLVIIFLVSLGLYFFVHLLTALYLTSPSIGLAEALNQLAFWMPALYGLVFLSLGSTWGRITTFLHLTFMGVVSLPLVLLRGLSTSDLFALLQLFFSNGVILLVLTAFGWWIEQHATRSRELDVIAHTDGLTQLSNRRQLTERLKEELARTRRYGTLFSIILLDIDHFKMVNDTYGHEAGDEVLREFAGILNHASRTVDLMGRWGGEEFLMLLPQITLEEAALVASRLRHSIEQHDFRQIGKVTASLGVTSYRLGDTVESLLKRADDALYEAKRGGRNQVAVMNN